MKRYVMTRRGDRARIQVIEGRMRRPLEHLAHKSEILDWTRSTGPGAGNAPSDLARSIVGDLLDVPNPAPHRYRELTHQLARIPHAGGVLTENEVRKIIEGVS